MSGSLLQRRGPSLVQGSEAVAICILLGKCSSLSACLAAEKDLTRRVKSSLQAERIPWVPGPLDNDWWCLCRRLCSSPASQSCCPPSHHPTSCVSYFSVPRFSGCIWWLQQQWCLHSNQVESVCCFWGAWEEGKASWGTDDDWQGLGWAERQLGPLGSP